MQISAFNGDYSSFDFKFKTSSGDEISLKMFDNVEKDIEYKKSKGYISEEFTLKHSYGYEFHYKGNGLDKEDLKEIKEAIKKIKPLFEKFLKSKETHEKMISNVANDLKSLLPKPKDENHENAIKAHTVNAFDEILKSVKASLKELEKTKKLFDKLFDNKFEVFA